MNDCFSGKLALITGASSGLGEQFARALAARGCGVVLVARTGDALAQLARQLSDAHRVPTHALACDLAESGAVGALCEQLVQRGLAIDILVNNAGVGGTGPFAHGQAAALAPMLQLNVSVPLELTRRLLPAMLERGSGGVIHVASTVAFYPVPYMASYGASKAFLLSFGLALHQEIRGSGVRALTLCPGPMRTGFQQRAGYRLGGLEASAQLPAAKVAERALRAYARGTALCAPGLLNALQAHCSRLLPLTGLTRVVAAVMRRLGRDRAALPPT